MTRKVSLYPDSVALVAHVKAAGPCDASALLSVVEQDPVVFAAVAGHSAAAARSWLLKRLGNLVANGWLAVERTADGEKRWTVRSSVRSVALPVRAPAAAAVAKAAPAPAPSVSDGPPVAPPWRGPGRFVPLPAARPLFTRPGALDFLAVQSRGFRC